MESFRETLHAWMVSEEVSATVLTNMIGYKSKTSVLRALRGESNYTACLRMYNLLSPHLSAAWQTRFQDALDAERIGVHSARMFEAIDRELFGGKTADEAFPSIPLPPELDSGHLMIFGWLAPGLYAMIDQILSLKSGVSIHHYLTNAELESDPGLLTGLIAHISDPDYLAAIREPQSALPLTWNYAVYIPAGKQDSWVLFFGREVPAWRRMEGGAAEALGLMEQLETMNLTQLYQYSSLSKGTDYLRFTENAYRLERDCRTTIVKPTPGMQMLPAAIVERVFKDFLSMNLEPVTTMREALICIFEKRERNFYHRSTPTRMLLSKQAMLSFVQTGRMPDHFYAFRPYTVSERIACLKALQSFSCREEVRICFRNGPIWPISFEAYGSKGVLLYPSNTDYNSVYTGYRELFLPGKELSELFTRYAEEKLFSGQYDNDAAMDQLIAAASTAQSQPERRETT